LHAWLNVSALVSGAQAQEMIAPSTRIAARMPMVGLKPIPATLTGNRKVLTAEPSRLTAVARPIPLARTSVGKLSAGNTPTTPG